MLKRCEFMYVCFSFLMFWSNDVSMENQSTYPWWRPNGHRPGILYVTLLYETLSLPEVSPACRWVTGPRDQLPKYKVFYVLRSANYLLKPLKTHLLEKIRNICFLADKGMRHVCLWFVNYVYSVDVKQKLNS